MSTLLRQEEAIANMARAQNNKFDYSKTIYKHSRAPLTIICPKHGQWFADKSHVFAGHGCPKCGIETEHARKHTLPMTL